MALGLKVEGEDIGKRIVDSLYLSGKDYYFFDAGIDLPSHSDHQLGLLVEEKGDKRVFRDYEDRLAEVSPITEEDGMMQESYEEWLLYRAKFPDLDEKRKRLLMIDFHLKEVERID